MNDIFCACIYQNTWSDVMCNGGYHPTGIKKGLNGINWFELHFKHNLFLKFYYELPSACGHTQQVRRKHDINC